MNLEYEHIAVDADVLMNLVATGCAVELLQSLRIVLYVPPTVANEVLYLESSTGDNIIEQIDLSPLERAGVLAMIVLEDGEVDLAVELVQLVDDGEAEVLAMALKRDMAAATDDRKARRLASGRGVTLVSTLELVHRWHLAGNSSSDRTANMLNLVSVRSHYRPARSHPLYAWWVSLMSGSR